MCQSFIGLVVELISLLKHPLSLIKKITISYATGSNNVLMNVRSKAEAYYKFAKVMLCCSQKLEQIQTNWPGIQIFSALQRRNTVIHHQYSQCFDRRIIHSLPCSQDQTTIVVIDILLILDSKISISTFSQKTVQ